MAACGSTGGILEFGFNFGGAGTKGADGASSSAKPLVIAAATELEDLEPAIAAASSDLGIDIHMEFSGHTLANTQELAHGNFDGDYDATRFATNRYVSMADGENTSGRSYDELKQYYDGLRGEKKPIPVFVILYGDADVKELSELAEYTGRRFFDALDGGLNEIFKGIRAYQNHPARDRHTQGHSPLAHMPRTLADITAQSASITPSAPKFPRAKETCFLDSPKNLRGIVAAGGIVGLHFIVGIGFVASCRSCCICRRCAVDTAQKQADPLPLTEQEQAHELKEVMYAQLLIFNEMTPRAVPIKFWDMYEEIH